MAVTTKFFVVRNGVELDNVFENKKDAEAYDRMLDAADSLAVFIKQGDLPIDIDSKTIEEVSIFLAKNAPEVTRILKGLKPVTPDVPAVNEAEKPSEPEPVKADKQPPVRKPKGRSKKI